MKTAARPIPVTVLAGSLGSGKTTLLKRLLTSPALIGTGLATPGSRLAILVNDFGAINLDAELIRFATDDVIELTNGCICCAITDNFVQSLDAIGARDQPPDRVVVE